MNLFEYYIKACIVRGGMFSVAVLVCAVGVAGAAFYAQGSSAKKAVALTFDDGPGPSTAQILAVLKERNVRATFFMEGQQARYRPALVAAVRDGGHEIGNHTYSHVNYYTAPEAGREAALGREIAEAERYIVKAASVTPRLLRMPNGYAKKWARDVVSARGYDMINWTFGCDWQPMTMAKKLDGYVRSIKPGAIFLLHDGGGRRGSTIELLPALIDEIRRQGYEIVTISELLGLGGVQEVHAEGGN